MIQIALAGYGYWGANLMRVFQEAPGCRIVACCEPRAERHDEIRARYPQVEAIDTELEATLGWPGLDAIVLATPSGLHYEHAAAALEAGLHVLVEKPLATRLADAEALGTLARSRERVLMTGHTFIYNDAVRWVREFIEAGELGEIYYAYFQRLSLGKVRADVDALWNLAPHDLSIALYWFGERPVEVQATGQSFLQEGVDDVAFMNLRFGSGRLAHVHVGWLDPGKTRRAVLVGSRRMVVYDDTSPDQKITVFDKGIDRQSQEETMAAIPFDTFGQFSMIQRMGDITIPKIEFREPLRVEADHFIECVAEGKPPLTGAREGAEVVAILEAADESRRTGRAIALAERAPA